MNSMKRGTSWIQRLMDVTTAVLLALTIVAVARPGSAVRESVRDWKTTREWRTRTRNLWPALQTASMPLYAGTAKPDVVVFSDYQCPFCRAAEPVIDSAIAAGLRVGIVHLPLPSVHPFAMDAATAVLCGARQGLGRELHLKLMSDTAWLSDRAWTRNAGMAKIPDLRAFASCMQDKETAAVLAAQMRIAASLQVGATPTFVGPRGRSSGIPTVASLRALAARE